MSDCKHGVYVRSLAGPEAAAPSLPALFLGWRAHVKSARRPSVVTTQNSSGRTELHWMYYVPSRPHGMLWLWLLCFLCISVDGKCILSTQPYYGMECTKPPNIFLFIRYIETMVYGSDWLWRCCARRSCRENWQSHEKKSLMKSPYKVQNITARYQCGERVHYYWKVIPTTWRIQIR